MKDRSLTLMFLSFFGWKKKKIIPFPNVEIGEVEASKRQSQVFC